MNQVCVGRQPLLDRSLDTIGYELLFRGHSDAAVADFIDGDAATARVLIGTFGVIGFDQLVGDKTAFVNLTAHYLLQPELIAGLPNDRVVLEIVESTHTSDEVVEGTRRLVASGYQIALDDFDSDAATTPLLDLAHVVKYDLRSVNGQDLADRVALDHEAGRVVVVERVETPDDFAHAAESGADYFQGYFFARPAVVTASSIPTNLLALVRLLEGINRPSSTIDEIVEVLSQDVSMSVMVLRFINSAGCGLKTEVRSIRQAALLIGRDLLRSWCALALMSAVDGKPLELVTLSLTRAKFCELVATERGVDDADAYYTVGMLSLLDAITDTPIDVVTSELALDPDIRAALLGEPSQMAEVLDLARSFEAPPADPSEPHAARDSDGPTLVSKYATAMAWATRLVSPADKR